MKIWNLVTFWWLFPWKIWNLVTFFENMQTFETYDLSQCLYYRSKPWHNRFFCNKKFCQFQHFMLETNPMNNRDSSFVGLSLYSMCGLRLFHKMGVWSLELTEWIFFCYIIISLQSYNILYTRFYTIRRWMRFQ